MNFLFTIEIPKRAAECFNGKERFVPGMEYHSRLHLAVAETVCERQDFCTACWEKQNFASDFISSWKSKVPYKLQQKPSAKKYDEQALFHLKETLKKNDPEEHCKTFILSAYLARKRLLLARHELSLPGQLPAILYEIAESGEILCIPKVKLSDIQAAAIEAQLKKIFNP